MCSRTPQLTSPAEEALCAALRLPHKLHQGPAAPLPLTVLVTALATPPKCLRQDCCVVGVLFNSCKLLGVVQCDNDNSNDDKNNVLFHLMVYKQECKSHKQLKKT